VITSVDSNVLIDVVGADPSHGPASADALRSVSQEGRLIACEVVWAEVAAAFASRKEAKEALELLNLEFSALTVEAALEAGNAWKAYRARSGSRTRVIADFLIGAHALCQADRLLTRDRGFYKSYFKDLSILDPSRI
jgi:hypothetical protein